MIIGLLGESKSGKDWLRQSLTKGLGLDPNETMVFRAADVIKTEAQKRYPKEFNIQLWEEGVENGYRDDHVIINESMDITRRGILRYLGDVLLLENPDYVKQYIEETIESNKGKIKHFIVPDVRNTKEAESVISKSGVIIKVSRSLKDRYKDEWKSYLRENDIPEESGTESGFKKYLEMDYPSIHYKITHHTETSVDEVPERLIHFKYNNVTGDKRNNSINSLVSKLSPLLYV